MNGEILRLLLLSLASLVLAATGILRRPGLGTILTLIAVAVAFLAWIQDLSLSQFGFRNQDSWIFIVRRCPGLFLHRLRFRPPLSRAKRRDKLDDRRIHPRMASAFPRLGQRVT